MKRISMSVVTLALASLAMSSNASAAGANDRTYYPTISPASVAPGVVQPYILTVENYSQNLCQTCTPLHFIQQIKITVPAGFTLVTPTGAAGPVSAASPWQVASITGSAGSPQVITLTSSDTSLVVGKSTSVTINAEYTGSLGACPASVAPLWVMDVNQTVGGGAGNAFSLSANGTYPKVTVGCLAQTSLALSLVTSEGPNSQTIRTTDTSASVTLTATLTKVGGGAVIGEPITFSLGAPIPACTGSTNGLGVVTCTFSPQVAPFPFGSALGTGFYFFSATFAGDANYGGTTSGTEELTVNADGTGITVPDVSGVYGAPVDLSAALTSQSGSGIVGKPITFFLNGIQVGPAVLTNGSGVASVSGVSTTGIGAGPHNGYILATFAGDSTYSAVQGLGNLTLSAASSNITLGNLTQIYNGTPLSPSVTTDPFGLSTSITGAPQTNVGSYPVTATITNPNYTGSASDTFNITRATLTATITAANKVYDTNTSATITSCTLVGLAAVDAGLVTCTASGTFASANVANGIVVTASSVTLNGTKAGNYQISTLPQTLANITPAASSVTVTGGSFVYNNAAHAATGSAATTAGSLTVPAVVTITYSGSCTSAPTTVAEGTSCTATGTYAGDANHTGSSNTASVTITQAASSVTVTGGSFVYNGTAHAATGLASTMAGSLTNPTAVTISYTGSCSVAPTTVAEGTTCTATGTYAGDDNHNGSSNTASVTITRAPQTVTLLPFSGIASSDGAVTYSINSGNCTVNPTTGLVTITGSTACSVTAAGDNYVPVTRTITISEN